MENSISGNGAIYTKERRGMKMENPFTLKVGQVFTGFGIGCGIGIGVGRPLNLGAIPVLNQVMIATRGATDAFSGVQRHVNSSLKKVGAKNIEAGIGCGVGFGHGFGVGIAVKPSMLLQLKSHVLQVMTDVITKFGIGSTLSDTQSILPPSLLTGMSTVKEPQHENTDQLLKSASKGSLVNTQYSSRTEKVLDNFLKSPLLKEEESSVHKEAGLQQFENKVLQMVLKHQLLIEDLMQENEKLRQILVKDLKVQPSKFESSFTSVRQTTSCTECFECRRKQRKR